jgi:hypothetical protein
VKKLIGIGGELESGKSTIANALVEAYGFTEKSFAKNLKDMCMEVFKLSEYQVLNTEGKKELLSPPMIMTLEQADGIILWAQIKNGYEISDVVANRIRLFVGKEFMTSRMILQFVGTEILRECIDDMYHINVVVREIENEGLENVVISDARFSNERTWIKSVNGHTILSYNPLAAKPTGLVHQSEQVGNPDDYDFTIINDKSLGLKMLNRSLSLITYKLGYEQLNVTK